MVAFRRVVRVLAAAVGLSACGGSSDTPPEPSTESLLTQLCRAEAAVECAGPDTEQRCLDELHEQQAHAQQEGCEPELRAYLKCASASPVTCGSTLEYGPEPTRDADCEPLNQAFWHCYTWLTDDLCGVAAGLPGPAEVSCAIKCPELSSLCEGAAGGALQCSCDSGPRVGITFQAEDCAMDLIWATGHHCTEKSAKSP